MKRSLGANSPRLGAHVASSVRSGGGGRDGVGGARRGGSPDALFDPHDAIRAMRILLRKLRAEQPQYEDEDVVSPQAAPPHAHRMDSPPHPGMPHREEGNPHPAPAPADTSAENRGVGAGTAPVAAPPRTDQAVAPGVALETLAARFDARGLRGTRKAVVEIVRLIKAFHAVPWSTSLPRGSGDGVHIDEYRKLMDELLTVFFVFANTSPHVRMAITADIVGIARDVCLPMRLREASLPTVMSTEEGHAPDAQPPRRAGAGTSSSSSSSPPPRVSSPVARARARARASRSVPSLNAAAAESHAPPATLSATRRLERFLESVPCAVPPTLSASILETFGLEQMIDVFLPPAVCSSRFDGVVTVLHEHKAALVQELCSARGFLAALVRTRELLMLSRLVVMCAYAAPRLRIRVYDRLIAEGLMRVLAEKLVDARRRGVQDREEADICIIMEILAFVADPSMDGESTDVAPPQAFGGAAAPPDKTESAATAGGASTTAKCARRGGGRQAVRAALRCVAWAKTHDAARIVRLAVGFLIDREHLSTAAESKLLEFLSEATRCDQETFDHVVNALHDAFDQIFCHDVSRVLPLILSIVASPFVVLRKALVETWFTALLVHATLPQVSQGSPCAPRAVLSKRDVQRALPFLSFVKRVAAMGWTLGIEKLFEQMHSIACAIVSPPNADATPPPSLPSLYRPCRNHHNGIAFGIAHQCATLLGQELERHRSERRSELRIVSRTGSKRGRNADAGAIASSPDESPAVPPPSPSAEGRGSFVWFGGESELPSSPSPVNVVVPWRDRLPFRLFGLSRSSLSPERSQEES